MSQENSIALGQVLEVIQQELLNASPNVQLVELELQIAIQSSDAGLQIFVVESSEHTALNHLHTLKVQVLNRLDDGRGDRQARQESSVFARRPGGGTTQGDSGEPPGDSGDQSGGGGRTSGGPVRRSVQESAEASGNRSGQLDRARGDSGEPPSGSGDGDSGE